MNTNDVDQSTSELIEKYFGFLGDYGFERVAKNRFESEKIRVIVECDPMKSTGPEIKIWFKSEPKHTTVELDWLIKEQIDYDQLWKSKSFEANIAYYADVLRKNINLLMNDANEILTKGLKRLLVHILKSNRLTKQNFMNGMSSDASKYYYYIKKKDPKWNPGKEL